MTIIKLGFLCLRFRSLLFITAAAFFLLFSHPAPGQSTLSASEKATSTLLEEVRGLMEWEQTEQAIPYLEELLVRLEGFTDRRTMEVRSVCMYQLGVCYLKTGRYTDAANLFQTFVEKYPDSKSVNAARLLILEAYAREDDPGPMQAYIEQLEQGGELDRLFTVFQAEDEDAYRNAILRLVTLYAESSDLKNLERFLPYCDSAARIDIGLNLALLQGGDLAADRGDFLEAVAFYRLVKPNEYLKEEYDRQIAVLREELNAPQPWVPLNQREALQDRKAAEEARFERMSEIRRELDARNYDPDLMLRIAHGYESMERLWTSYYLFEEVSARYPGTETADQSLFSAFQVLVSLEEYEKAKEAGYAYSEKDPPGRFYDHVTLGLMHLHLVLREPDAAESLGLRLLARSEHRFADQVTYLLGTVYFDRQDYETALRFFTDTAEKWPDRMYAEEAEYWTGMCCLFMGRFVEAVAIFQEYLANPLRAVKAFEEDVTYRLGMAQYGLEDFASAETTFLGFIEKFPESDLISEAFSMAGDLRGAEGDLQTALDFYRQARERAVNIQQENYAVFQAVKVYELENKYDQIVSLLEDYLEKRGEEADFARSGLWLTKSLRELGREKQAFDLFCRTIVFYGNDPLISGIDELLHLFIREIHREDGTEQLKSRLQADLDAACADPLRKPLCLRLTALFARVSADESDRSVYSSRILQESGLNGFSPFPLLLFAEESAAAENYDQVQQAYDYFISTFSSSELLPDMINLKISALIETGRYDDALALADESLLLYDGYPQAGFMYKLTGDILRRRGDFEQAVERYNNFLSVREWRGPLTPEVLYWIGVCRFEQRRTEEAYAFFQRTYVLYETYTVWAAKAYERSADCLEKLGRRDERISTWREMAAHPLISQTPEGRRAQEQLNQLSGERH